MKTHMPATKAGEKALKHFQELKCEHKVAVGLSGGVDSSLTAALLVEAGWEVEGITLWLMSGRGACCSEGLVDAAAICKQLGILHHVIDSRETFNQEIIQGLIKGYQEGVTPLPCSRCNKSVKFSSILEWAINKRKINKIATGHYARTRNNKNNELQLTLPGDPSGRQLLLRGIDPKKDQSYFLYDLSQDILEKTVFPLGELNKSETREEANRYNLRTANKAESQDLCLAEHYGSMKQFLDEFIPPRNGEISLNNGTVIGKHDGIEHFTIGQRKGLGISWKEPLHVIRIEPEMNRVIVAPRHEAGKSSCIVGEVNWVSIAPPNETINIEAQIRYQSKPVKAKLKPIKQTKLGIHKDKIIRYIINFEEEQFSITPGQAAVFYSGNFVLGGGLIQRDQ